MTDSKEFHPQCRPEEVFDPKSGSCIPITNIEGATPKGTLECPPGYVLDESRGVCVSADPLAQAKQFKPTGKMERCIQEVKTSLRKRNSKLDESGVKSAAIAICRSRIKAHLAD